MDCSQLRARQRAARGGIRGAATAYTCRVLQSHGDRERRNPLAATARAVPLATVRDRDLSLGAGAALKRSGLRDRARKKRAARDQGLQPRISGGIESAPSAN